MSSQKGRRKPAPRPPEPAAPRPRGRAVSLVAGLVVLAAVAGSAWWWLGTAHAGGGPIIFISIDTLRADHLPIYGYRSVRTPAIDALAKDGLVFERAYAHAPQTLPSHVSILSGRLPFESGVRDNVGFTIRPDMPLLAELLRAKGYATGGAVSSFVLRKETGLDRGFDFYDSHMPEAAPDRPIGQIERPGEDTLAVARRWMDGLASPRFFLFFHIYEPHKPYAPPARFSAYAPYDGEIAWSDEIVGHLLDYLKARKWYDDATIVLVSDHGEGLGDHGEQEHGLFVYDETIRAALAVKLPRERRAGVRVVTPVQHIDLVPTVLDWVGAPAPAGLRGRSLRSLLETGTGNLGEPGFYAEALYGRYHYGWSDLYALTDARFRFIKAPRPELYDLEQDQGETRNLAESKGQTAAAMRSALDTILSGAAVDKPGSVSKEDIARLQALGYVGSQVDVSSAPGTSLPDPKDKIGVLELHRRAVELGSSRDFDGSIALLKQILAGNAGMKDLWLQLGVAQVRAGRLPDALATFKRLVEVDPSDGKSLISVAQVLTGIGRLDEAAANARAALAILPAADAASRASAYEVLVNVALAGNDAAAARKEAAEAQKVDPGFPLSAYTDALILYNAKRYAEALPLFQETITRIGARTIGIQGLYYYTGDTLARLGEARAAIDAFTMETRLSPEDIRAHRGLAVMYRTDGQIQASSEALARLVRSVPTPDGYAMAIRLATMFGERDRAATWQREAAARFGDAAMTAAEKRTLPEGAAQKPRT